MAAPVLESSPVTTPPPPELAVPDRYALRRELGRGGMGVVWLADDRRLGRPVAIKILPRALAGDAALHERFVREVRLAASLAHPNVVPVHEIEEHAGQLLLVMGYVDGETLGARVARGGPLPVGEALRALRDVAWALAYAHERGVVHRDVKPDNVLVERGTGRALLVDFGIARTHHAAAPARGGERNAALTRVGEVVGTPHFMSPEQATGDHVDARSDIYSLGVTAFTVLTGRVPFDGVSTSAIIAQQLTAAPPDLAALRPDLPRALVQLVERCLAKEPAERFPDAHALADALDALAAARPAVAPEIRAAETATGQTLVVLLGVAALTPSLVGGAGGDDRYLAVLLVLLLAALALARLVGIARGLAAQGLPRDAARVGFRALAAERREAVVAMRAAGVGGFGWRRGSLFTLGVLALTFVKYTQRTVGTYPWLGWLRLVLAIVGVAFVAIALMQHLLRADRVASAGRVVRWLWLSPLGGALFALGARGARAARAPRAEPRRASPPATPPAPPPLPPPAAPPIAAAAPAADARGELREALELAERLRETLRRAVEGER